MADQIKKWPKKIQDHKEEIARDGIKDSVIENFQISSLTQMTDGYGKQAIDDAMSKLKAWHDEHFWKTKKSKMSSDDAEDEACTP